VGPSLTFLCESVSAVVASCVWLLAEVVEVSRQKKFFTYLLFTLLLVACGGEDKNGTVPQAADPNAGGNNPLPTVTPPTDNRLPEWVDRTGKITLVSSSDYSNLEKLFGIIYPPVVGDPKIAMDIDSTRSSGGIKKLYLGVEDDAGFTYREWTAIDTMSTRSSTYLDGYFLDDQMVVHVGGNISSSPAKVNGTIQFRVRATGETQCVPSTVTYCSAWHTPAYYAPGYCGLETNDQCFQRTGCQRDTTNPDYVWCCDSYSQYESLDTAACQSYMGANPSVKTLGNFEAVYSKWLK